jgi:hypothetical protein
MSMLPTIAPVFEMLSSPAPSVMLPVKVPALAMTVLPPAVMLPVIWPPTAFVRVAVPLPSATLPWMMPPLVTVSLPSPSVMLPWMSAAAPLLVIVVGPVELMFPMIWPTSIPVKSLTRFSAPAELTGPLN